ncbi:MAG: type II toxin-antitoxin system RelE/ParE family toxin [Burkholderiaceae bacterium]|nr:type II toxin-antitoxin system RelE/ParE family toxin [Burkholderiaceae bacterium]
MPDFRFSAGAEHDLEDIIDYTIERWGVDQAVKYMDGLEDLAGTLARTPALGRRRDDLLEGLLVFPMKATGCSTSGNAMA